MSGQVRWPCFWKRSRSGFTWTTQGLHHSVVCLNSEGLRVCRPRSSSYVSRDDVGPLPFLPSSLWLQRANVNPIRGGWRAQMACEYLQSPGGVTQASENRRSSWKGRGSQGPPPSRQQWSPVPSASMCWAPAVCLCHLGLSERPKAAAGCAGDSAHMGIHSRNEAFVRPFWSYCSMRRVSRANLLSRWRDLRVSKITSPVLPQRFLQCLEPNL